MTLTVRLEDRLEAALELHCAERGVTKSLVVQESLAAYLASASAAHGAPARPDAPGSSPNLKAFADAGLLGAIAGSVAPGRSADKAAVRGKVAQRMAQRAVRRGGA